MFYILYFIVLLFYCFIVLLFYVNIYIYINNDYTNVNSAVRNFGEKITHLEVNMENNVEQNRNNLTELYKILRKEIENVPDKELQLSKNHPYEIDQYKCRLPYYKHQLVSMFEKLKNKMLNTQFKKLIDSSEFSEMKKEIKEEIMRLYWQIKSHNQTRNQTRNILTELKDNISILGGYRRRSSVKRYKSLRRYRAHTKSKHKKRRYSRYRK